MKKILLGTIALTAFSCSIILFQISCKKSADAATPTTSIGITQQNKIIYTKNLPLSGSQVYLFHIRLLLNFHQIKKQFSLVLMMHKATRKELDFILQILMALTLN
jgi:hypothetical protein